MTEPSTPENSQTQEENDHGEIISDQQLIDILTRGDPNAVPDLKVLNGFLLGRSPRQGDYLRLYLTLELNKYIEFPHRNLVFSQSLRTQQNPLAGTIVWVDRDTKLQFIRISEDEFSEDESHLPHKPFANIKHCDSNDDCGTGQFCNEHHQCKPS